MTEAGLELDFRIGVDLDVDNLIQINEIAYEIRGEFINVIDSISKENRDNIDWWLSKPATRDPNHSGIFYYCCLISLLKTTLTKGIPIKSITVDSPALLKILKNVLNYHGQDTAMVYCKKAKSPGIKSRLFSFLIYATQKLCALLTRKTNKFNNDDEIILIDTFALPGFLNKDRYFPGLLENLKDETRKQIFFVPTIVNFSWRQIPAVMKKLREKENFIIKEDFLRFSDLLFAFSNPSRRHKVKISPVKFKGIDISSLVKEELSSPALNTQTFCGLLNYRFAKRLKETRVKISLVIDWFENQIIDKGWNLGFNQFFPEVETLGYHGMTLSDLNLNKYPTETEFHSGVIPKRIKVMGSGAVQDMKTFFDSVNVSQAPSFRFSSIFLERKNFPTKDKFTIMFALSIKPSDALRIIKLMRELKKNLDQDEYNFLLKAHPALPLTSIDRNDDFKDIINNLVTNEDFTECLEKSNLLISMTSSVCLEALAHGTPVIVLGALQGLTFNPIPKSVAPKFWRCCFSPEQALKEIKYFKEANIDYHDLQDQVRKNFFTPLTQDTINNFISTK